MKETIVNVNWFGPFFSNKLPKDRVGGLYMIYVGNYPLYISASSHISIALSKHLIFLPNSIAAVDMLGREILHYSRMYSQQRLNLKIATLSDANDAFIPVAENIGFYREVVSAFTYTHRIPCNIYGRTTYPYSTKRVFNKGKFYPLKSKFLAQYSSQEEGDLGPQPTPLVMQISDNAQPVNTAMEGVGMKLIRPKRSMVTVTTNPTRSEDQFFEPLEIVRDNLKVRSDKYLDFDRLDSSLSLKDAANLDAGNVLNLLSEQSRDKSKDVSSIEQESKLLDTLNNNHNSLSNQTNIDTKSLDSAMNSDSTEKYSWESPNNKLSRNRTPIAESYAFSKPSEWVNFDLESDSATNAESLKPEPPQTPPKRRATKPKTSKNATHQSANTVDLSNDSEQTKPKSKVTKKSKKTEETITENNNNEVKPEKKTRVSSKQKSSIKSETESQISPSVSSNSSKHQSSWSKIDVSKFGFEPEPQENVPDTEEASEQTYERIHPKLLWSFGSGFLNSLREKHTDQPETGEPEDNDGSDS